MVNNNNQLLTFILNLVVLSLCCAACQVKTNDITDNKMEKVKPQMAHTVFFWLKEGTSESDKRSFENGLEKLSTVPTIHLSYWGRPASTENRDVVDNSYQYAINSFFATVEDHDIYQEHPIHLEFIENHNAIWEKVVVYDNNIE